MLALTTSLASCSPPQRTAADAAPSPESTEIAPSESTAPSGTLPVLVREIGGASLGSDDTHLRQAFGRGLFTDAEGHVGARYYTDARGTVTLHVVLGVDGVVDTVELRRGIALAAGMSPDDPGLASRSLSSSPDIGRHLRLGARASDVIAVLGRPGTDKTSGNRRTISYSADSETDSRVGLYYEAEYSFVDDQLVAVRIYDGE